MELYDLKFNDKDVRRILKLAVKRGKYERSKIDTNYDSQTTYEDLMEVAKERGLNPNIVRGIVETQEYRTKYRFYKNRFYKILFDNLGDFFAVGIGSFGVGFAMKNLEIGEMINPIFFGALSIPIIDFFEFTFSPYRRGNIKKTLQNDVGTFAGATLGYTLASLLYNL